MSHVAVEDLRDLALGLPEPERAELAYSLVASLDGPTDLDVEQAGPQIEHRLDEVDSGAGVVIESAELIARLRAATRG